jgi:uncharacterized protein (TIGR01777 family)
MKVLITGGTGFIGRSLARSLVGDGHEVWALSRHAPAGSPLPGIHVVQWDARSAAGWGMLVNEMDVVVNLAGKSLSSWPWTKAAKQEFRDSRVNAGRAVVEAFTAAGHRPRVLVQSSGINHYGLDGDLADESTPPAADFLARLTVDWEGATRPVEDLGVRRVVTRSAVVLGRGEGLLPLMALPVRLFVGGPLANGKQAMPWIHVADEVGAVRFLIDREDARGAYNLIAPQAASSAQFVRAMAILRLVLGEMSTLVSHGRFAQPKRLLGLGYRFKFPTLGDALSDIFPA